MLGSAITININSKESSVLFGQLQEFMSDDSAEVVISMLMYAGPEHQDFDQFDVDWSEALEYYQETVVERSAEAARYINRQFVESTLITTGMIVRAIHAAVGKKICEFF